MASTHSIARIIDAERIDAKERVECLRLQATAWRLLAVIATHDADYARSKMQWLMMVSVPFIDGEALEKFIADHERMAEDYGRLSGVFA